MELIDLPIPLRKELFRGKFKQKNTIISIMSWLCLFSCNESYLCMQMVLTRFWLGFCKGFSNSFGKIQRHFLRHIEVLFYLVFLSCFRIIVFSYVPFQFSQFLNFLLIA